MQILTPAEYSNAKAQLKAREDGGWKRVEWSLARRPHLHELEVVHGRMIAPNPKVSSSALLHASWMQCCPHEGKLHAWRWDHFQRSVSLCVWEHVCFYSHVLVCVVA